jgi:spore maturation protein CgeB
MRVIVVDSSFARQNGTGHQIVNALNSLGHEVRPFSYRKWHLNLMSLTNSFLNIQLVRAATNWPADLIIVIKGETINLGTISKITKSGIKAVNWNIDEPFGVLDKCNKISNMDEYDSLFIYDLQYVEPMKQINPKTYYLPAGAEPDDAHKEVIPLEQRQFPADLCLVGTAYDNRKRLIEPYAGRSLRLAGAKWDTASHELAKIALPLVTPKEMIRLFNESKVVINPYGQRKEFIVPNPRTFEIPASRSFQLTDMPRDVDRFFKEGKEILVYKDEKEFKELADYYIENDEERNKIAQAGYDRVVKEHTMTHRVRELLRHI